MQISIIAGLVAGWLAVQGSAFTDPGRHESAAVSLPAGYVIGVDDHLTIAFWRDKELSADVVVRPDGRISLPLLNDIAVAGLTPEQLRVLVLELASKFVEDPTPSVVVREIHSRQVF